MKAGDRIAMTLHDGFDDRDVMCVAVEGATPATLMLMTEDGECIATVRQFWQTAKNDTPRAEHIKKSGGNTVERHCNNCGAAYQAKKADLKRGWGLCCSKACAAEYRGKK